MQDPTATRPTRSDPAATATSAPAAVPTAAETLYDQRALQILSTEHWGLLSARALAYNESFTRAGMFLTFLSMSFVALALLAQGIGFGGDFIVIAALALGFNLLVGLFTLSRIITTWIIDGHATQGMNRIRNGYTQIAPAVGPFFITGTHDDEAGVNVTYGIQDRTIKLTGLTYGLSTTLGMVGVIVALLAGLLGGLIAIGAGVSLLVAGGAGAITAGLVFLAELVWAGRVLLTAALPPRFPTPDAEATLRR